MRLVWASKRGCVDTVINKVGSTGREERRLDACEELPGSLAVKSGPRFSREGQMHHLPSHMHATNQLSVSKVEFTWYPAAWACFSQVAYGVHWMPGIRFSLLCQNLRVGRMLPFDGQ